MTFNTPTTKEELYTTLQSIFNYYRIRKFEYEEPDLEPLTLGRITVTEKTDTELRAKAAILLAPSQKERVLSRKESLSEKKTKLNEKLKTVAENKQTLIAEINSKYSESVAELKKQAVKKGISESDIVLSKLAKLEAKKAAAIVKAETDAANETSEITAEISAIETAISGADTYYSVIEEKELDKKAAELKDEQDKLLREAKKYNDNASEKEQRYANTIIESNASLKIKYLSIHEQGYSKDELINMGYYKDALTAVSGYYDSIDVVAAYNDIKDESKLMPYIDDYYPLLVNAYKIKAAAKETNAGS